MDCHRKARQVSVQETGLATALDELVRLDDELVGKDPGGKGRVRGDGVGLGVPGDLRCEQRNRSGVSCPVVLFGGARARRRMHERASEMASVRDVPELDWRLVRAKHSPIAEWDEVACELRVVSTCGLLLARAPWLGRGSSGRAGTGTQRCKTNLRDTGVGRLEPRADLERAVSGRAGEVVGEKEFLGTNKHAGSRARSAVGEQRTSARTGVSSRRRPRGS